MKRPTCAGDTDEMTGRTIINTEFQHATEALQGALARMSTLKKQTVRRVRQRVGKVSKVPKSVIDLGIPDRYRMNESSSGVQLNNFCYLILELIQNVS